MSESICGMLIEFREQLRIDWFWESGKPFLSKFIWMYTESSKYVKVDLSRYSEKLRRRNVQNPFVCGSVGYGKLHSIM